jgi:hypothetical protein
MEDPTLLSMDHTVLYLHLPLSLTTLLIFACRLHTVLSSQNHAAVESPS